MEMSTRMTAQAFLDYIRQARSKNTYKSYKRSVELFSEWFGESPDEILAMRHEDHISGDPHRKKRFQREIEKFHKWMREEQGFTINSARANTVGILQLFRYHEMPVTIPAGSDVSKTVISTKDFVLRPQHLKAMYKVGDLRARLIVSMGKDLGWRIGDFSKLRKDQLPDLELPPPIEIQLITEKEDVIAQSFLSPETVDLLKAYLPTLPKDNPYLFPTNRHSNIDPESVNRILKQLADKVKITIPKRKRLRFHCFRKLFLSTCANLKVDINIAKILVGKQVEKDMLTYLSGIDRRKAFLEVYDELAITKAAREVTVKDAEIARLKKELEKTRLTMKRMVEIYGEEIMEKAIARLQSKGIDTHEMPMSILEALERIGREEEEKQKEEYKRLLEENINH